ncbi:MAG: peptidase S41, partial [Pseudomonadota bacterium]|nr:peptidase S41 [Pseudomonadota bacterium]
MPMSNFVRPSICCAMLLATLVAIVAPAPAAAEVNGFYRFPSLRGEQIWFTAEGDLWRVGTSGGKAERVTTHPGSETRAVVSPGNRWVAYSAAYEGPAEAYVMDVDGGVPKRLTWNGLAPQVWQWTRDGRVLVTMPAASGQPFTQLYSIDPKTTWVQPLPVVQASDGAISDDGKTLYFTRNGLRGDNVRGYRGGAMPRIWQLALEGKGEATPLLAGDVGTRRPMPYT